MRKSIILTVLMTVAFVIGANAQSYQEVRDTIYAANVCIEDLGNNFVENTDRPEYAKNGKLKKRPSNRYGEYEWVYYISWPSKTRTLAYYLHIPEGHCRADMLISTKSGKTATIHAKLSDPLEQKTLMSWDINITEPGTKRTIECMPDIEIERDGWYRLEFISDEGNEALGRFEYMLFQRESKKVICTPRIYSALATYLNSWRTTNEEAPTGASFDCVYLEVQAPEDYESINSYISTMNLLGGYLGIQSCLNLSITPRNYFKNFWHNVIFSMWDNGDVDKTPYLPDYLRSGGIDKHPKVKFNRFGNEGTGIQAMKGEGDWWQPGKWVQMLFTCRPEDITVDIEDENGNPKTIVYNNTLVSLWYKMADEDEWTYQATLRKSGTGNYVDTWGAFLENWVPTAGQYERRALFRNCYLHSIASNKWYNCNRTTSGYYYDPNRLRSDLRDRRVDMDFGVYDDEQTTFFMSAGGYFKEHDGVNRTYTIPLATDQSCVDTIDLSRMHRRVEEAIRHNEGSVILQRFNSDPTIEGMRKLAEEKLNGADQFNGYRSEDLQELKALYADENTSTDQWRKALTDLADNCLPLKYSSVLRMENIGSYRAYQLSNASGGGIVMGTETDGVKTLRVAGSTSRNATEESKEIVPVTDTNANWVIIRRDRGTDYYLYNIGLHKFLDLDKPTLLNEVAIPLEIAKVSNGFTFKQNGNYLSITPSSATAPVGKSRSQSSSTVFELFDNITMQPDDAFINEIIEKTENSAKYVELLNEIHQILDLPAGVVGSVADADQLAQLQQAYDESTLSYDDLSKLLNSVERVPFEPATTLYRVRSAGRNYQSHPYLTADNAKTLTVKAAADADFGQLWSFDADGDGYKVSTQGNAITAITGNSSQNILIGDEAATVYLVDLGGCHFTLRGAKTSTTGLSASSSTLKSGTVTSVNAQWFLEPVRNLTLNFDNTALMPFHAAFHATLPANVKAYTAQSVDENGVITTQELAAPATIPAGTAALVNGASNGMMTVSVGKGELDGEISDDVNLFRGTFLTESMARNQVFLLATGEEGKAVMTPNVMTTIPANTIYIAAGDVAEGLTQLTFSQVFTGISGKVANAQGNKAAKVYDLQGRPQTDSHHRNVYVVKGKKIIEK